MFTIHLDIGDVVFKDGGDVDLMYRRQRDLQDRVAFH